MFKVTDTIKHAILTQLDGTPCRGLIKVLDTGANTDVKIKGRTERIGFRTHILLTEDQKVSHGHFKMLILKLREV
jgi:hypothetical protein